MAAIPYEDQPNSPRRKRIILTRTIGAIATDPSNAKATLWNPAGASFEAACGHAGVHSGTARDHRRTGRVRHVYGSLRHLLALAGASRQFAGRRPCFSGVPRHSPQQILAAHGLRAGESQILDIADDVSVTPWRRTTETSLDVIGGLRRPRQPAISRDHEQRTDQRQIFQRMDQVVPGVGTGLIPEVVKEKVAHATNRISTIAKNRARNSARS